MQFLKHRYLDELQLGLAVAVMHHAFENMTGQQEAFSKGTGRDLENLSGSLVTNLDESLAVFFLVCQYYCRPWL